VTVPRVEPYDEETLLARAQAGDREAFERLIREHQDTVYTLALRLTGNPDEATEVAQQALIRAWRALPRFRGDARLSTWLHRITVNTAWSRRRHLRRRATVPLEAVPEHPAPPGPDHPETAGELAELRASLRAALNALPPEARVVVVLKDVMGWSHAEIAVELGISVPAAKVRLHRAHRRLQVLLEGEGAA
jgi:RNA polymerase sigma-70 factor, ECF subfamily